MKKGLIILTIICFLFTLTACKSEEDTVAIADGTYILDKTGVDELFLPQVKISDGDFTFTYNLLSSYMPIGTYTIEGDILTLVTDDQQYQYVFRVDGDTLVFQEKESSELSTVGDKLNIKITDQAKFTLKDD